MVKLSTTRGICGGQRKSGQEAVGKKGSGQRGGPDAERPRFSVYLLAGKKNPGKVIFSLTHFALCEITLLG